MSDGWTPGPWRIADGPQEADNHIIAANHRYICEMSGSLANASLKADARLISAAPDMAEALEDCIDALNDLGASVATNMIGRAALEKARAALAKARGQA